VPFRRRNDQRRAEHLLNSGVRKIDRWLDKERPADLEAAIKTFSEADAILAADAPSRFRLDGNLGFGLASRYSITGSPRDRDRAIGFLSQMLSHSSAADDFDEFRLIYGRLLAVRLVDDEQPSTQYERVHSDEMTTALDVLSAAAASPMLDAASLAEASLLHARLTSFRALERASHARQAGGLGDTDELRTALRLVSGDDPCVPWLRLELGLAHGYPATLDPARGDRRQAIEYLTEAVRQFGPADPECALALCILVQLLLVDDSDIEEAEGIARLAEEGLRGGAFDQDMAAILRLLTSVVRVEQSRRGGADPAAMDAAIQAQLDQAQALGAEDHFLRAAALASVAGLVRGRHTGARALDDHDTADSYSRILFELVDEKGISTEEWRASSGAGWGQMVVDPAMRRVWSASRHLMEVFHGPDLAALDQVLDELGAAFDAMPHDHQFRPGAMVALGEGWRRRAELSGDGADNLRGLRLLAAVDTGSADREAIVQGLVGNLVDQAWYQRRLREIALSARALLAYLTGDEQAISAAIEEISGMSAGREVTAAEQVTWLWQHGITLAWRHELTGDRRDLSEGIAKLEDASRRQGPAEDAPWGLLQTLASMYRSRGDLQLRDPQRAIDTALLSLRQRAAEVLLQPSAAQGLTIAGVHESLLVALYTSWCLADGRIDQAVAVLELGRAMVLHATTVAADVPDLLRAAGHDDLAGQWRAEVTKPSVLPSPPISFGASQPLAIPAGVRRKVLGVLRGIPAWAGLLEPPDIARLASVLQRVRGHAFVYLTASDDDAPGQAVLLREDGALSQLTLPALTTSPVTAYEEALKAAADADWTGAAQLAWHRTLTELCDWAWTAVTGPLLEYMAQWGRPPRLVLIPAGRLGAVPWHAARHSGPDGEPRYAIEDAVFMYAASARQLAVAADRRPRRWDELPVLVSNPTADLTMAEYEGQELLRRYYPGAVYLGQPEYLASGQGTPDEVLSRLPGGAAPQASLLHVGCHAKLGVSLAASHLVLADGQKLPIARIVAQAQAHDPLAPGFLTILAACMSDLADIDHDESLTLASAFLAAGATGVIGASWPTLDRATASLMLAFHHFLNEGNAHPADALRAAQLRMLDPPYSMRRRGIHTWAAFTYQGA
jgi:CHAT domain